MSQTAAASQEISPACTNTSDDAVAIVRHLAHELRQPLSTIESIAYCLAINLPQNQVRARQQVEHLRIVLQQAHAVIADVVFLVETPTPRRQLLDLSVLLSECLRRYRDSEKLHAEVELRDRVLVNADPNHLQHVTHNLINFGRQVVSADGCVKIGTRISGSDAVLQVSCEGVSFDTATLEKLFECSEESMPEGLALTLASVRRIVEAHAGRIETCLEPQRFSLAVVLPTA